MSVLPVNARLVLDLTIGDSGHAEAILARLGKEVKLIGFDRDAGAIAVSSQRLKVYKEQVELVHDSYANLDVHLGPTQKGKVDFALLDLGLSSTQLEQSRRGFSHQSLDEPLDLRFDASKGQAVSMLLRRTNAHELSAVLAKYGEVQRPRKVAEAIASAARVNRIGTVAELSAIVSPFARREKAKQFLSQVWQALRIWVNDELSQLERVLPKVVDYLAPDGIMAVISFHSLEDRMVKQFIVSQENPCVCPPSLPTCVCGRKPVLQRVTRKAIRPGAEEVESNPRSRSARLRVARRLSTS